MQRSGSLNLPSLEEIESELARRDYLTFVKTVNRNYTDKWFHRIVAEKLEAFTHKRIKNLMIFQPPQTGKSELASRNLPPYIFGHYPKRKIIQVAYSYPLAGKFNRDVQRVILSPDYKKIFPGTRLNEKNVRTEGNWLKNSDEFEIVDHAGRYLSIGRGGGGTGNPADYIIIDDPFKSKEEAASFTIREKVWDVYNYVLRARGGDDLSTLLCVTRWHEDDLAGRILESAKLTGEQLTIVSFPALYRDGAVEVYDTRTEFNQSIWPEKFSTEHYLKKEKEIGSFGFESIYQQRPRPAEGSIIKAQWINYYKVAERPKKFDLIIQSWDLTFKKTASGSYVCGQVWGLLGAKKYLIEQFRERIDFVDTKKILRNYSIRFPRSVKLIEDKANGPAIISELKKEIPGIIAISTGKNSKEERLMAVSPQFEAGDVVIPSNASFTDEYLNELLSFPSSAQSDQVDSTSQALDYLHGKEKKEMPAIFMGEDRGANKW